jgi:hypothetical protein
MHFITGKSLNPFRIQLMVDKKLRTNDPNGVIARTPLKCPNCDAFWTKQMHIINDCTSTNHLKN